METPILFLIFNRPNTTARIFRQIRKTRPKRLFIAADGPRPDRIGEYSLCIETRNLVTSGIDWTCDVQTLFRERNIGCGKAVSEAISWFFKNVEEGIILEDDCLPDLTFFSYCENLLKRYASDERVFLISGTNPLTKFPNAKYSYTFSRHAGIWGWATWRRAWELFDYTMQSWHLEENKKIVQDFFEKKSDLEYYCKRFDETFKGINVTYWDFQWYYTRIIHNAIGIVPTSNLISNIGFGTNATHTIDETSVLAQLRTYSISKKIIHPDEIRVNSIYEELMQGHSDSQRKGSKAPSIKILQRLQRFYQFIRRI